jgi:hypothetical protein|tara:strand:+ start:180 stop:368 length:189 start_codon:yes stop_codon:yes gene_type:complete
MTKAYHLISDRNRNIIVSATKLEDLRRARNLLNKIDKDFIKKTKEKPSSVNFEIVESRDDPR